MAEQLRMGVLKRAEKETFVMVALDPQDGQFIKRIAFHTKEELRQIFKDMGEAEFDLLITQLRAHPVD